ncbi:MAG: hypothetical protein M3Q34_00945 [bacterium]|nr:hypothetical protein [bacterium]
MQNFNEKMLGFDYKAISFARRIAAPLARFAIFLVYFWFGILKVLETSPASALVVALLDKTMPFIAPDTFLIAFGALEMVIGILFIIPRLERLALLSLFLHLITTIMPLFLLPQFAWDGFLVPTLEGQYMIKNILIVTAGIVVLASLKPYKENNA